MCLSAALLLLSLCGSVTCVQYEASFSMAGVTGWVDFNLLQKNATGNLIGINIATCGSFNLSITEFPVMYGHVAQPCENAHIGDRVLSLPFAMKGSVLNINISDMLANISSLDAYSLLVETCSGAKACAGILPMSDVTTLQARFFGNLAGNIYVRRVSGEPDATLLADLVDLNRTDSSVADVYSYQSSAPDCQALLTNLNPNSLKYMGWLKIGTTQRPVKSRLKVPSSVDESHFALFGFSSGYSCAKFRILEAKSVSAGINVRGEKGYLAFYQKSPFDPTLLTVNLTNYNGSVGHYHVHQFPTPELQSPPQSTCSNDNVGGHWNPFGVDTQAPKYPPPEGSTHDMYEVGDLSGRHGSLKDRSDLHLSTFDYNLPLFGQNSIVGRSVVLHEPDGTRFACTSIGYPGEVVVARAVFQTPVVGFILFTQLKANPYSDVSVFLDLSYGRPDMPATQKHHWHIHTYPISTETDSNETRCSSTGGHWNPYMINNSASSYKQNCRPESPFACEIGDLSTKHKPLNLAPNLGKLLSKSFFTDTTSWVTGPDGMLGRSVVIHGPDEAGLRIACANVSLLRLPAAQSGSWEGPGSSRGHVQFFQTSPQGLTNVHVSLGGLEARAGGYHVHVLPVKSGIDACSNENVMGHFNPHGVNASASPLPGTGTVDQYEVGDISGKFGTLKDQDQFEGRYVDGNMPLSGPNSIVGRSLVIHYKNGTRMQCANISAVKPSDGYGITARAVFTSSVKGTVTLFQQSFPDGSYSDVTLLVDINANKQLNVSRVSWYITEDPADGSRVGCSGTGGTYNPFNMSAQNPSCAFSHLACEVGDLTSKHGSISVTERQLYTDTNLQLAGDFTVVYRSLVLKAESKTIACAGILPVSPSAQQIFPVVSSFSRYDFRKRVADVLQVHLSRVSILPGTLTPMPKGKCQQVTFLVSGEVDLTKLASVKNSEKMGPYKQTKECTTSGASDLLSFCSGRVYSVSLAVIYLLHILLLQ